MRLQYEKDGERHVVEVYHIECSKVADGKYSCALISHDICILVDTCDIFMSKKNIAHIMYKDGIINLENDFAGEYRVIHRARKEVWW